MEPVNQSDEQKSSKEQRTKKQLLSLIFLLIQNIQVMTLLYAKSTSEPMKHQRLLIHFQFCKTSCLISQKKKKQEKQVSFLKIGENRNSSAQKSRKKYELDTLKVPELSMMAMIAGAIAKISFHCQLRLNWKTWLMCFTHDTYDKLKNNNKA